MWGGRAFNSDLQRTEPSRLFHAGVDSQESRNPAWRVDHLEFILGVDRHINSGYIELEYNNLAMQDNQRNLCTSLALRSAPPPPVNKIQPPRGEVSPFGSGLAHKVLRVAI